MILVQGSGSKQIGDFVAKELDAELVSVKSGTFPDGEIQLCVSGDIRNGDVILLHSTGPPQNDRLIQLFLLIDACRNLGAKTVRVVTPYMAYARQDRRQTLGECVSILTLIKLLGSLQVNELFTINVHNPAIFIDSKVRVRDLSAFPLLAKYFRDHGLTSAFSLTLGKKPVDIEHARTAAAIIGGEYGCLKTFRDQETGAVTLDEAQFNVEGKDAIIFDDVITTGNTHLQAVNMLKQQGAKRVYLACVHSLLSEDAHKRVKEATDEFVCTDTIPNRCSKVSVAPLIVQALR